MDKNELQEVLNKVYNAAPPLNSVQQTRLLEKRIDSATTGIINQWNKLPEPVRNTAGAFGNFIRNVFWDDLNSKWNQNILKNVLIKVEGEEKGLQEAQRIKEAVARGDHDPIGQAMGVVIDTVSQAPRLVGLPALDNRATSALFIATPAARRLLRNVTPGTFGIKTIITPGPRGPLPIKGKSPYANRNVIDVDAYAAQPVKAQIPKYAQNAKIPMPELAKQQRVEHAFQFSMKDTYGLPDVTTSTGKLASKLDSIKYHYDNRNLLDTSQRAVLDDVLDTFKSKDLRGFKAVVGTTIGESVTAGQRAYGKITVDPGPSTPHHGGGIDQTATPQLRFGDKGVLLRNQLNIDYSIPTADDPLNYYGVYDVATRGLRQAKLDSLAPLYDKITKNKPRNIKQFTGITLNDAFGSSDIAFGKPGGKVTPGTYPIIRGINNEDILRTQNNIKPGSPITDRIWKNRWNHIADYYGISKNVFRKFNRNPEISPDDITVSADHITIHDLITAGQELEGTALHEVERLGGNVQDLTKPQPWEKLDPYKAGAILGESIAESHAIALGVLMEKVEIIRQDPILKQLWNETKVDDIPMLMEQLKTEFAGKGWFEFISKNKSKWVKSILEGDLLKNYDPTDLKKIQKGFKLKVPTKLWQKDFRTMLREVWGIESSTKMSEPDAIRTDLDIDAFRAKQK